jgi:hypothetical protein
MSGIATGGVLSKYLTGNIKPAESERVGVFYRRPGKPFVKKSYYFLIFIAHLLN